MYRQSNNLKLNIMKHGQLTKASQGKISHYLRSLSGSTGKGQSEYRELLRDNKSVPNSTKGEGGMHHGVNVIRSAKQIRSTLPQRMRVNEKAQI